MDLVKLNSEEKNNKECELQSDKTWKSRGRSEDRENGRRPRDVDVDYSLQVRRLSCEMR